MCIRDRLQITYQPAAGGCSVPTTEFMWLYEDVDASWTTPSPVCSSELPLNLNDFVTGTAGGVWSGECVEADGTFNPAIIPATCTVTYTVGTGECSETVTHQIYVMPSLENALNDITVCESPSGTIDLMAMLSCLLYTSPSPRDPNRSRMPSSA